MIKANQTRISRICQGDIIKNIEYIESVSEKNGIIQIYRILFPHIIVLTQDCDLAQDYSVRWGKKGQKNEDKKILSALVAPLYNVEHIYEGTHLSELGHTMQIINKSKTPGRNLRNNETPRYHYLEFTENIPIVPSVIDFKHYFSLNLEYLKKIKRENFVCKVSEIYREDISQRFASYLARIALP